ncbi:alpha/beta hydrolase fold protein [alpha proteobacterium IMCC14465]|mgnify:FL=1|uniref:Alpha/beta hydrolase fold protein n=1 Tax=alpha proteobacterium IMCC14465 TaxID=1220535 RepID=J9DXE4_9PROT|nr:alpha/beta hydrolase fold protein [alpha proteobacterium IMCC14465]|tara:strand:+ start:548 stop:1402 length:855 start_codon:yes stop_codon:yes gene_type:complete
MAQPQNSPEIGETILAAGVATNIHDNHLASDKIPVMFLHGSGPGVSAWANWRLNLPIIGRERRVIAPDILGFGFTQRPENNQYSMPIWLSHLNDVFHALDVEQVDLVGNSFGGALAIAFCSHYPERVRRLVLMGSAGIEFPLTAGLDAVWGYQPSEDNMLNMMDVFAYNKQLVNKELAALRYKASIAPGVQEAYENMFPAPRQEGITKIATAEDKIKQIKAKTLIVHGRDDQVIPLENSYRLHALIDDSQLHVFGRCGHWTQIEYCDEFNQQVIDFFDADRGYK